jgi:hypothetical protein
VRTLTTLGRRSRGPAAQGLRGVSHLRGGFITSIGKCARWGFSQPLRST